MKNSKILVFANWKMTPKTLDEAKKRVNTIKRTAEKMKFTELVIMPPAPFVEPVCKMLGNKKSSKIKGGCQDVSTYEEGAHTGEVGADMLKSIGSNYVIVGHSERRARGEDNSVVDLKIQRVISSGMTAVLCVGEHERDNEAEYLLFIKNQIRESLAHMSKQQFAGLMIAYEPLWAVNNARNVSVTGHELHQMVIFIKKVLREAWGPSIADIVKVIYGGSVTANSVLEIVRDGEVDGVLIGRASWEPDSLKEILKVLDTPKKKKLITNKKISKR